MLQFLCFYPPKYNTMLALFDKLQKHISKMKRTIQVSAAGSPRRLGAYLGLSEIELAECFPQV